jgi:hypothetical protein
VRWQFMGCIGCMFLCTPLTSSCCTFSAAAIRSFPVRWQFMGGPSLANISRAAASDA